MDFGLLVSKALGYGIVAGSLILQAPQIAKIISNKSVAGLSATTYWLQLIGYDHFFVHTVVELARFHFIFQKDLLFRLLIHTMRDSRTLLMVKPFSS